MTGYGPPIVVALDFETAIGEVNRAICSEGLTILARIDIRDHFWRVLGRDIRPYALLEAWFPEIAIETLRRRQDVGVSLPSRFAVYELDDGSTAIAVSQAVTPGDVSADRDRDTPRLSAVVEREYLRIGCILARLRHTLPAAVHTIPKT